MSYEIRYYDRQGQPITMQEWVAKLGDLQYKRVAYWEQGEVRVSTVWLGLEHSWNFGGEQPDYPVHIFETMVFGSSLDQNQWRYATEELALQGHSEVVILVKSMLSLEGLESAQEPVREEETQ